MGQRFTPEQWAKWYEEFDSSGMTIKVFCDRKQVSENTFDRWRTRLRRDSPITPTHSFVPVAIIQKDLLCGHLFVFRNRNRDRLKILYWDRNGPAIWYKWLEKRTFQFPTGWMDKTERALQSETTSAQLSLLLGGIDLRSVYYRKRLRPPSEPKGLSAMG